MVSVSVADPAAWADNKLVVTYAYKLGSRTKSFDQLCDAGKEIARQHNATWSETPTYVQKSFTLPKSCRRLSKSIVPTPQGEFPVYPRMLLVRREVISPSAAPLALPTGAVAAAPKASDELASLPNPFLIGSEMPAPVKAQPVQTAQVPLHYLQFCDEKDGVGDAGVLAWPKNAMEQGKVSRARS